MPFYFDPTYGLVLIGTKKKGQRILYEKCKGTGIPGNL